MTTIPAPSDARPTVASRFLVPGWICLIGAVIGIASGLYTGFAAPAASHDLFRYPFTPGSFVAAQLVFTVNHLMLLAGLLALYRARAAQGRTWAVGISASVVGLLGWTACELWAITLVHHLKTDHAVNPVITGYGIFNTLLGVGLIITGVAVARASRLSGWPRWVPLVLGIAVFVVVLPGVFGPFLAGRLALSLWMAGWAALGVALLRGPTGRRGDPQP